MIAGPVADTAPTLNGFAVPPDGAAVVMLLEKVAAPVESMVKAVVPFVLNTIPPVASLFSKATKSPAPVTVELTPAA